MRSFLFLMASLSLPLTALPGSSGSPWQTLPLWPGSPPGAKADPSYVETESPGGGEPPIVMLGRVSAPRVEVFLPEPGKGTGAAVVICPGGGYGALAYDHEGRNFARWFADHGIAGVVLFYRLPSPQIMVDPSVGPLQDVQEALRLVRRHATAWSIAPDKVGVMGFSAGGHLAATASTMYNEVVYPVSDDVSACPSFSILVYGVLSFQDALTHGWSRQNLLGKDFSPAQRDRFSNELHVNAQTPPTFLVHAADDGAVLPENSLVYFAALQKYHVPSELHIVESGGHGFGMRESSIRWLDTLDAWLSRHQWSRPPAH